MTPKEIYEELRKPFDLTCYSVDTSRGFDLTSLKAQYISIRLNEVLGLNGWEFDGVFEKTDKGVVYHGLLTLLIGDNKIVRRGVGSAANKKSDGDLYKSAMTDALSKCASYIGIAEQAFCGLIKPEDVRKANGMETKSQKFNNQKKADETSASKPAARRRTTKKDADTKPETPKSNSAW